MLCSPGAGLPVLSTERVTQSPLPSSPASGLRGSWRRARVCPGVLWGSRPGLRHADWLWAWSPSLALNSTFTSSPPGPTGTSARCLAAGLPGNLSAQAQGSLMFSDELRFWGALLGGGHPGFLFGAQSWHRLKSSVPNSRAAEPRHSLTQVLCVGILPFGKNSRPPWLGASH